MQQAAVIVLRYGLTILGTALTTYGVATAAEWSVISEHITTIVTAIGAVAPMLWALYVRHGTKAVPNAVADKPSIPTVSPVTGTVSK